MDKYIDLFKLAVLFLSALAAWTLAANHLYGGENAKSR